MDIHCTGTNTNTNNEIIPTINYSDLSSIDVKLNKIHETFTNSIVNIESVINDVKIDITPSHSHCSIPDIIPIDDHLYSLLNNRKLKCAVDDNNYYLIEGNTLLFWW